MKRVLLRLFTVIFSLIFVCVTQAQADDYTIGVLAKRGAAKAMKKWSATAEYLTKTLSGHQFTVIPLDFEEVFTAIENQKQECRYLVIDFGTSQSPKSTRLRDSRYCPGRPASEPLRHTFASSVLATQLYRKWLDAAIGCDLCFPFGAQAHVG